MHFTRTLTAIDENSMDNSYNKESKEYMSNGHYSLKDEEFMSVWT